MADAGVLTLADEWADLGVLTLADGRAGPALAGDDAARAALASDRTIELGGFNTTQKQ